MSLDVIHVRMFHIKKVQNLNPKAEKYILLDYVKSTKYHGLYDVENGSIIKGHHVKFVDYKDSKKTKETFEISFYKLKKTRFKIESTKTHQIWSLILKVWW